MINTIIFSENNPARLRILLQSLRKNALGDFNYNVIHRTAGSEYEELYEKLKTEFSDLNINWTGYSNFKDAVLRFVQTNCDLTMFLRDDNVLYEPKDFSLISKTLETNQDVLCFSLRLGNNTQLCRNMNTQNAPLVEVKEHFNAFVIEWDWSKHYLDFGFPWSTEGHIFRTKELLKFIKGVNFTTPDEMEANFMEVFEYFPKTQMCSFSNSVLVKDIAGPDQKQINELWKLDKPIEFNELDFSKVDGCWSYIPKPTREVKQEEIINTNAE
jgi:hypothetical protein